MDVDAFVLAHRQTWNRLDELVKRRRRLTGAEVDELVELYQRVSTHLSMVRTSSSDSVLVGRLSSLVARARSAV
ncbi:MAG TPA: stage II sporulation protein M, partial [Mycobacterium sp.]|nr:stage II sporulation protein M [Mycobacterium sp.]